MADLRQEIPGYAEAVEAERFNRDAIFLGLTEDIGKGKDKFAVLPLSLRHVLQLRLLRSPLLTIGLPASSHDIFRFLWTVWPDKSPKGRKQLLRRCRRFGIPRWGWLGRAKVLLRVQKITAAIRQYLTEAFADWPPGGKGTESYYSNAAAYVSIFAREYGWSEAEVLDMPLKKLFQYYAEVREFHGKALFNPSGRLLNEWLLSQQPKDSAVAEMINAAACKRN